MLKIILYAISVEEGETIQKHFSGLADVILEKAPLSNTTLHADADIVCLLPSSVVDDHLVRKMPRLQAIISLSSGLDHIDLSDKTQIQVINNPTFSTNAVSEYILGCLFQAYQGRYRSDPTNNAFEEISGKVALVVGYGNIGKAVVSKLKALGLKVNVYSAASIDPQDEISGVTKCSTLKDGVKSADVISLNTSLRPETLGIFNDEIFTVMKPEAILINAARGDIIDNKALLNAIRRTTTGHMFLDDISDLDSELAKRIVGNDNVTYTYHTAWHTRAAISRRVVYTIGQINLLLADQN